MSIKLLAMDVDGTLTDGMIYMGPTGEQMKAFHIHDGYGIRHILPEYGITPVIITGRESLIVQNRAKELNITCIYQNVSDKSVIMKELAKEFCVSLSEIAYIGDDLNDLPAIELAGVRACPKNAVTPVKSCCDYICTKNGGDGAVREFIDWLVLSHL
ncbi:MAG: HAD hydrolase family protein [Eubacteriales bacterium]